MTFDLDRLRACLIVRTEDAPPLFNPPVSDTVFDMVFGEPEAVRKVNIPDNVKPDDPLRLEIAAALGFPDGSMTVSGLRNEIAKGNLHASKLAGKMYTTLNSIQQMRERCIIGAGNEARERISTSARPSGPEASGGGSSSTRHQPASASNAAQAHLKVIAQRLKQPSANTSPENTSPTSAVVIPLKS